jgi:hypothetical protein
LFRKFGACDVGSAEQWGKGTRKLVAFASRSLSALRRIVRFSRSLTGSRCGGQYDAQLASVRRAIAAQVQALS